MNSWSILCDFDGTISVDDVTDLLLERFGKPGWQELEERWRRGEISSRICMQSQIGLLDANKSELDEAIDSIRIDPDFCAFVQATRRRGWPISIVSDGLDYAIVRLLRRHGIDDVPVFANHLKRIGRRSWQLDSPNANKTCYVDSGTCKCARVRTERSTSRRTLLIGDGASDYCAASCVDFVFAKHKLNEYCRAHNIHHTTIVGFADAIDLLPALAGEAESLPVVPTHRQELRTDAR